MNLYKTSPFGYEVDLDNPVTFNYLPNTKKELEDKMFSEIGKTLWYMNYIYPDVYTIDNTQRIRIEQFIVDYTKNRLKHSDDLMWLKQQIFLLQDETENQC